MKKQQKTKAEILQDIKNQQRAQEMREKAKELRDFLFNKGMKVKDARIALQVTSMMMQQSAMGKANKMLVSEFALDELVNKDKDYDVYRELVSLFSDTNIKEASEILSGMNSEIGDSIERSANDKPISEVNIEIL